MKYTSSGAFRQALENRLKDLARAKNISLVRLRKQIAFERFIARLQSVQPDIWILKGGLAMQLRLGTLSRTTKDVDLLNKESSRNIHASLVEATSLDMGDWFVFEVGQEDKAPQDAFGGHRYHVRCLLDGREFEAFHVDVGVGDLLVNEFYYLRFDAILDFADIASTEIPCYPVIQQIAEKLHALTREYKSGGSSRMKDFVDILLLAGLEDIDGTILSEAILSTFEMRKTHSVPSKMPALSKTLHREYTRLAKELDLRFGDFHNAEKALAEFINPVFSGNSQGIWRAKDWRWEE